MQLQISEIRGLRRPGRKNARRIGEVSGRDTLNRGDPEPAGFEPKPGTKCLLTKKGTRL